MDCTVYLAKTKALISCAVTVQLIRAFVFALCKLRLFYLHRKPNILDNMVAIMEKYASNLEALVEDRTDQLREEKKKTEELLLQMLPK